MLLARFGTILFWLLAVFYSFSAAGHIANIMGWTGFDWSAAPLAWKVQNVVYLFLNLIIVICIVRAPLTGAVVLGMTALSQILLYTVGPDWGLNIQPEFRPPNAAHDGIDTLVLSHFIALVLATLALWLTRIRRE